MFSVEFLHNESVEEARVEAISSSVPKFNCEVNHCQNNNKKQVFIIVL